ncbi:MAG: dihydroorotate dehydrogenase [Planctomycetota bacterium]|nr:dihydroorotate dehydrogenase [Planctomycetota bacterium]
MTTLTTNLAGVSLRSPIILAAGTAGVLDEMSDVVDLSRVGAIVTKSITRQPREGNATWRILPAEAGMLNAIGLANPGLDTFVREIAPRAASVPAPAFMSIAGYSIDDYVTCAAAADALGFPAVELNVSCPNVHGGCEFGADPTLLATLVREVRRVLTRTRLFVKLSPVSIAVGGVGIVQLARAAIEPDGSTPAGPNQRPGADALCLCNTTPAMAIDVATRRPRLANVTGGLSGAAVHPIVVKIIHDVFRQVAKQTTTPIIGIGGVQRWEHAAEFVLAGASCVEVGTALFADPRAPIKIAAGLERWVRDQGAASLSELVGQVRLPS